MCGASRANNVFVCQPDGRLPPSPLTPWPAQKLEVSQFRGDSFLSQKHTVFGSKNIPRRKVALDLLKFHRMSGLQPPILPPPPIPMPSSSVLAEELYKCANPPPSYSVAVGAPDATPVQGRHQLQPRDVIVGPFGGSLCRVVPITSAQLEPPPAYSRRSPSNGDFWNF